MCTIEADVAFNGSPILLLRYSAFFYEPKTCGCCDGTVHHKLEVMAEDARIRGALEKAGYRVVVIRYDKDLTDQLAANADVFGKARCIWESTVMQ